MTDSSGNTCPGKPGFRREARVALTPPKRLNFKADYYPYGQENDYSTSCSPTYKFTGYEFDSETGNYYAYARYYSPRLGRFLSADLLGGDILNPQSLNRYAYVLNNPETFIDPLGLNPTSCTITLPDGSQAQGLCATTTANAPSGDLKDFLRFLGEAGPNGCGPYGCPKPPPADTNAYTLAANFASRVPSARPQSQAPNRQASACNSTIKAPTSGNDFTPVAQTFAGIAHVFDLIVVPASMVVASEGVATASAVATVIVCSNPVTCGLSVITVGTGAIGTGALLYGAYQFTVNQTIPYFEGKENGC